MAGALDRQEVGPSFARTWERSVNRPARATSAFRIVEWFTQYERAYYQRGTTTATEVRLN